MRNNHYGINCDYALRREFHRPFWDALGAQFRRWFSTSTSSRTLRKTSC